MFKERGEILFFIIGGVGITVYYMLRFLDIEIREVINTCLLPVFVLLFLVIIPKSQTVNRFFNGLSVLRKKVKEDLSQKTAAQKNKLDRDFVAGGKIVLFNLFDLKKSIHDSQKSKSADPQPKP
jgi:hypothetical protein